MNILINYSNEKYLRTQKFNSWTGINVAGFDKVYSYNPNDIDNDFFLKNEKILSITRGNGLWLWKPYLIKKALENSNPGDKLFYCDSGAFFIRKIDPIINNLSADSPIWVSDVPLREITFTKPICFEKLECDDDQFKMTPQIQATFIGMFNCPEVHEFIEKWLKLCQNYELISPEYNISTEDFIAHREDQSLLSLLCKLNGIHPQLDPSHRGKYPKWYKQPQYEYIDTNHHVEYKPLIFLHKSHNVNIYDCLKQYLKCIIKTWQN